MFITISTYLIRVGEEDAIIALHEDWQRQQQPRVQGFLSAELLRNLDNTHEFISIMRFEHERFAQVLITDSYQNTWQQRLASLSENNPAPKKCTREWSQTI